MLFLPEYRIKIGDAEQNMLQVKTAGELAVLVTVSIPPGHPERTALNLTGPILINHEARIGLQVPQADVNPPRVCCACARPGITERTRRPRPQTRRRAPMPLLPP